MIEWHIKTHEELERLLETNLEEGLAESAADLRGTEKKNILFAKKQKDKMHYAKQMLIVLLPLLVLVTAIAALLSGKDTVGYTLLFSSAFCILCLFSAYSRARFLLENAEEAAESSCRVLRGGEYTIIPHEEIVTGDLVYLEKGDFVPADCRLIRSASLVMRENGITAKDMAEKNAAISSCGDIYDSANMIWAGTVVESGIGVAVVCQVGDETHFRQTLEVAKSSGFEETSLYKRLMKLSSLMTASLLGVLFLSAVLGFFSLTKGDFFENWMLIAALTASAMADFYGVFAYITAGHALYGIQSSKKKLREGILLKRGDKIETLAGVDRFFVTPEWFWLPYATKTAYLSEPFGRGEAFSQTLSPYAQHLLRDAALAIGEGNQNMAPSRQGKESESDLLLRAALRESVAKNKDVADMTGEYSLISVGKTQKGISYGVIVREGRFVVTLLAASSLLVPLCRFAYRDSKLMEVDEQRRERIFATEQNLLAEGENCVRECYAVSVGILGSLPDGKLTDTFIETTLAEQLAIEGFVTLETPIHKPSDSAFVGAKTRQMGVVLFCESEKDRRLAAKLGLAEKKPTALAKGESCAILSATLAEKLALLRYAKKNGEVVAYAGRDFDELAHMKEADLSLKLSAWQFADEKTVVGKGTRRERLQSDRLEKCGCDAFRYSADLLVSHPESFVKLDGPEVGRGGFDSLASAIRGAGKFFFNLRVVFAYLAFSTAVKLIPTLLSLFLTSPLISPSHLAILGLVFDPLVALSLALAPYSVYREGYCHSDKLFWNGMLRTAISGLVGGCLIVGFSFLLPSENSVAFEFASLSLWAMSLTAFVLQSLYLKQSFSRVGIGTFLLGMAWFVYNLVTVEEFHLMSILFLLLLWVLFLVTELAALTLKKDEV